MTRWDDPGSDPLQDLRDAAETVERLGPIPASEWRMVQLPVCEVCGDPVTGWHRDIVDQTNPLVDNFQVMVPGQAYNEPCNCPVPGTAARPRRGTVTITDRTPSGERTSADTGDVVSRIDAAVEDWETLDGARWSPDGSHEHDPSPWTRMNLGVQQGQADWGCDDVAERMENPDAYPTARLRPGSTACFPWDGAQLNTERMQEAARGFTDAIHQMQMSLYRGAARATRRWSEVMTEFLERNEPVRVQLHTGRNHGRTEAIRRLQREIEQGRIRLEIPLPHHDLEPLELPTITPGDTVRVVWPDGNNVQFTIDEHERRARASWEGLT